MAFKVIEIDKKEKHVLLSDRRRNKKGEGFTILIDGWASTKVIGKRVRLDCATVFIPADLLE